MISNTHSPQEPSIAINPGNTRQLVAGANLNNFYYSSDGGNSWKTGTLKSKLGVWGDPVLIVDTAGIFYFFHLSDCSEGNWIDRIICQKSTDGGATWSDGTWIGLNGNKAQDKPWATVDRKTNIIYVTWTQFDKYKSTDPLDSSIIRFSKSTDGAETWSEPIRICKTAGDCIDSDMTVEGAVPAVGPGGEIYAAWIGPDGLVFNKSSDQGKTWLEREVPVTDIPGGWDFSIPGINRCNGLPVICCDTSQGPYRGMIYINWSDQRNGPEDTDIWLTKSADGGTTWSIPIRVNDDLSGRHQFFSWMTIDQANGLLYFVFYDRRNYTDRNTDVFMAVSEDAGETFINFRISESPFIPDNSVFFGDYINIAAYDNVIRPVWAVLHRTALSIMTAMININLCGIFLDHTSCSSNNPMGYHLPCSGSGICYSLQYDNYVTIRLSDIYGNNILSINDNCIRKAGYHILCFNNIQYNLPAGYYVYTVITQENIFTGKMTINESP